MAAADDDRVVMLLLKRLPHDSEEITRLFASSDDFRQLCRDYASCAAALSRLAKEYVADIKVVREYEVLMRELHDDVKRYLRTHRA